MPRYRALISAPHVHIVDTDPRQAFEIDICCDDASAAAEAISRQLYIEVRQWLNGSGS
jgi:hypothetical protein